MQCSLACRRPGPHARRGGEEPRFYRIFEASGAPDGGAPLIERIVDNGALRVGMSGSQPPLDFRSSSGELVGLEVHIARGLAAMMGVEPSSWGSSSGNCSTRSRGERSTS